MCVRESSLDQLLLECNMWQLSHSELSHGREFRISGTHPPKSSKLRGFFFRAGKSHSYGLYGALWTKFNLIWTKLDTARRILSIFCPWINEIKLQSRQLHEWEKIASSVWQLLCSTLHVQLLLSIPTRIAILHWPWAARTLHPQERPKCPEGRSAIAGIRPLRCPPST